MVGEERTPKGSTLWFYSYPVHSISKSHIWLIGHTNVLCVNVPVLLCRAFLFMCRLNVFINEYKRP